MNSLILSVLVAVVALFHGAVNSYMRKGKVKTGFCAVWCMDAIFAIGGTVLSFLLYHYAFYPLFTWRNLLLVLFYLMISILFMWMTPSGFSLLRGKRVPDEGQLLLAEYRLNDTLGMVRSFFMTLLFLLPLLYSVVGRTELFLQAVSWRESEICGGFCFVAFLILIPISLRQALFWLKHLTDSADAAAEKEKGLLRSYASGLHYRSRNWFL